MKRMIFAFLLLLCFMSGFAKVQFGNMSYDVIFNMETQNDSICLLVTLNDNDNKVTDTPKLLIKLFNDSIIELQGKLLSSTVQDDYGAVIGGMILSENMYVSNMKFQISKSLIESIKNGIKKIRLNSLPKYREKEWGKDKIGKALYKEYSKCSSNSFRDGF